jgi:hypothetical protein
LTQVKSCSQNSAIVIRAAGIHSPLLIGTNSEIFLNVWPWNVSFSDLAQGSNWAAATIASGVANAWLHEQLLARAGWLIGRPHTQGGRSAADKLARESQLPEMLRRI